MAFSPDTAIIVLVSLAVAVIVGWMVRLEIKFRRFTLGKNGASLEESIRYTKTELEKSAAWRESIERYLRNVERRLSRTLHEAKTVRFNAFKGTGEGGNQSFATAFLSEEGNGVVVSSVFTRDRVSVYAKPVEKRASTYDLTDEEREAITIAAQSAETTKRS